MNVPKLRFKADDGSEFPEWEEKKIGDFIEIYDEKVNSYCELPILTSSKKYGIQYQNDHFGREQLHDISGYNVLPYGYCTYRNRSDGTDFTFNINTLCKRGIVSKFYPVFTSKTTDLYVLASLLNNEKSTVKKIAYTAKGTGQKVLSISDLQNINVRIPCVAEQKKIAAFLSTIDDIITTTQSELTAWQERKKGVMQKIFNREVRFKADDGSEFPEWEEKRLGEVLSICHGKDYKHLSSGVYPVLGTGGVITYVNSYLCNWECALIGRKGTIDKPQYMDKPFWCVDTLFYTEPEKQQFPKWQYYLFQIINWNKYNEASGVPSLSASTIENILVNVPSLPEQRKIADCLSSLDDVINQIQDELLAWKEFKKGLLQQMFV